MLGPTYLDFIFLLCLFDKTPEFLSRFRNLAGATHRIKIDKTESQVAPAGEAVQALLNPLQVLSHWSVLESRPVLVANQEKDLLVWSRFHTTAK